MAWEQKEGSLGGIKALDRWWGSGERQIGTKYKLDVAARTCNPNT